jgi:hypothetical protein
MWCEIISKIRVEAIVDSTTYRYNLEQEYLWPVREKETYIIELWSSRHAKLYAVLLLKLHHVPRQFIEISEELTFI